MYVDFALCASPPFHSIGVTDGTPDLSASINLSGNDLTVIGGSPICIGTNWLLAWIKPVVLTMWFGHFWLFITSFNHSRRAFFDAVCFHFLPFST